VTDLEEKAFKLLISNKKEGYSRHLKRDYFYFAPDEIHYHQWFWDSCFHSIVMTNFKVELAIKEFDTLLSCQAENGFLPHIIFWKWRFIDILQYFKSWRKEIHPDYRFFTAEIQPPVIGITLRRIYEKTKSLEFLKKYLPRVQKYFDYLKIERDLDKNFLISIITPMESGMDMAPQFDIPYGNVENDHVVTKGKISAMLSEYKKVKWNLEKIFELDIFNFEDVAVNTIYALALENLAYLWNLIDKEMSTRVKQLYTKVKQKIIEKYWDKDDKIFYGRYHKDKKEFKVKIKTISSLFPLCLDLPENYVESLVDHIVNKNEFWLTYPIPSVAKDEKSFGPLTNTRYIWRGTTWINTNWFLAKGLLRHGKKELYEKLKAKTLELVEKHGFCEYYDPFNGEPGEAMRNFGWSTLAVDM
jgi:glycogen debranching enzyme